MTYILAFLFIKKQKSKPAQKLWAIIDLLICLKVEDWSSEFSGDFLNLDEFMQVLRCAGQETSAGQPEVIKTHAEQIFFTSSYQLFLSNK